MLARLHTHLAMLKRQGKISAWYDRMITAGENIDEKISSALDSSEIFLALVSPDFLHSNYCYEQEMKRALERADAGSMRVIPVILEPCDWLASPLKQFKALPKDGKPVSDWANPNTAFMNVIDEIRALSDALTESKAKPVQVDARASGRAQSSAKYRVKKSFDAIDREDFRAECFRAILDYFRRSIEEINSIENLRGRFEQISARAFTATVLNRAIKDRHGGESHITVRAASSRHGLGDVYFSFQENAPDNTANGSFSIEADDYRLYLRLGLFSSDDTKREWLPQEAAAWLWEEFLEKAGVSYG